ncbi:Putative auto-transporter adhesin, head GIN domain [Lutibacter oricola]|uniref:Putative auto-transporter adhesin, head GIN domain n=1 Tax=Lutibacter oricola TaxID=762486 RepID=A0A1H3AAX2_9FLAO|nr:head GIN domain-containing protein [Lutibacter oricola]SDX26324.1 Putative auto-transporter adhesin, head GIN domain [Lutibacter oricola]
MKLSISILALFICISANAQWNKKIKGSGNIKTETRNVSDFEKISVSGSFDIELIKGKEGKITVTAYENLLEYIVTETENGKLKIKPKDRFNLRSNKPIKITVTFEEFDKLSLAGSGNIFSDDVINNNTFAISMAGSGNIDLILNSKKTGLSIAGSGNLNLKGETDNLKASLAGSGNLNAYDLKSNIVNISIAGSGNVKVHAENEIKASIVGSGDVSYTGNPTIEKASKIGSGSFKNKS